MRVSYARQTRRGDASKSMDVPTVASTSVCPWDDPPDVSPPEPPVPKAKAHQRTASDALGVPPARGPDVARSPQPSQPVSPVAPSAR